MLRQSVFQGRNGMEWSPIINIFYILAAVSNNFTETTKEPNLYGFKLINDKTILMSCLLRFSQEFCGFKS